MIQEKGWYRAVIKTADIYNAIINFICVVLLTAQTLAIIIMVFGRYIFEYVPPWTEQFAIFCMIWFAMFSIALAVRDDSHVKMEVIDNYVSPQTLCYFKLFGMLCIAAFGLIMVIYGISITKLTWNTKLSAFRISSGIQYFSSVAGGFFMVTNAIVYSIEMFVKQHDDKMRKEGRT